MYNNILLNRVTDFFDKSKGNTSYEKKFVLTQVKVLPSSSYGVRRLYVIFLRHSSGPNHSVETGDDRVSRCVGEVLR